MRRGVRKGEAACRLFGTGFGAVITRRYRITGAAVYGISSGPREIISIRQLRSARCPLNKRGYVIICQASSRTLQRILFANSATVARCQRDRDRSVRSILPVREKPRVRIQGRRAGGGGIREAWKEKKNVAGYFKLAAVSLRWRERGRR